MPELNQIQYNFETISFEECVNDDGIISQLSGEVSHVSDRHTFRLFLRRSEGGKWIFSNIIWCLIWELFLLNLDISTMITEREISLLNMLYLWPKKVEDAELPPRTPGRPPKRKA